MTRVLIAADETEASLEAARVALKLFGDSAEYLLINVGADVPATMPWGYAYPVEMPMVAYPPVAASPEVRKEVEADAERLAADVAEELAIDAEPIGAVGDPAEVIAEAARSHEVDVIVVGSHEHGWFSRLFGGSVADEVVRKSAIPVLVVG